MRHSAESVYKITNDEMTKHTSYFKFTQSKQTLVDLKKKRTDYTAHTTRSSGGDKDETDADTGMRL